MVCGGQKKTNIKSSRKCNTRKTFNSNDRKRKCQVGHENNISTKQKKFEILPGLKSTCLHDIATQKNAAKNDVNRRQSGMCFDGQRRTKVKRKCNAKKTNNSRYKRKRKGQEGHSANEITTIQEKIENLPGLNTSTNDSLVINLEQYNSPLTRNTTKQVNLKKEKEKLPKWESIKSNQRRKNKRRNNKKLYEMNKEKQKKYQSLKMNQIKKNRSEKRKYAESSYSMLCDRLRTLRRK